MKRNHYLFYVVLFLVPLFMAIMFCEIAYADEYSITYRGNGGYMVDGSSTYIQTVDSLDSVTLLTDDAFSNGDMILMYWKGSDGGQYLGGETYSFSYGVTLTAQWGYGRICYYDKLPDEEFPEPIPFYIQPIKYSWSDAVVNNEIDATAIGWAFIGWNTEADGTGEWFNIGQKIEYSTQLDLYAQYNVLPENYIRYSSNGSNLFDGKAYAYVSVESFPSQVQLMNLTDIGNCTYLGWNTQRRSAYYEGETVRYAAGSTVYLTEDTTLYVDYFYNEEYFGVNSGIATYNGNGGFSGNGSNMKYNATSFGNLRLYEADVYTREGYYLDSWNRSSDGSGKSFLPGESVVGTASTILRLYAHWTEIGGKGIVYYANGGAMADGSKLFVQHVDSYDQVELADADLFENGDLEFVCWENIDDSMIFFENEIWNFDHQMNLRALWGYGRVTYHGNGGTFEDGTDELTELVFDWRQVIADETLFENEGKAFVGWNTEIDGSGSWYHTGKGIGKIGRVDLYAQWIVLPEHYLCLDADGSDVLGGKAYEYIEFSGFPADYILPAMIDTDDCVGLYWSTTPQKKYGNDVETINYMPETSVHLTENQTLYTKYVEQRRDDVIVYFGNGGVSENGSSIAVQATSGGGLTLYGDNVFHMDGYKIKGWNSSPDGSGSAYQKQSFVGFLSKILKLYAQWEEDPDATHVIVFDPITIEYGTDLFVGLYDDDGRMLSVTSARIIGGYPQAEVLVSDYFAMEKAVLFRVDDEDGRPVGTPLEYVK